jgi:hypothetical protein
LLTGEKTGGAFEKTLIVKREKSEQTWTLPA